MQLSTHLSQIWYSVPMILLLLLSSMVSVAEESNPYDFEFSSRSESSDTFYSRWTKMLGPLQWEVWGHRILVTVVIIVVWELFLQPNRRESQQTPQSKPQPNDIVVRHRHRRHEIPGKDNENSSFSHQSDVRDHQAGSLLDNNASNVKDDGVVGGTCTVTTKESNVTEKSFIGKTSTKEIGVLCTTNDSQCITTDHSSEIKAQLVTCAPRMDSEDSKWVQKAAPKTRASSATRIPSKTSVKQTSKISPEKKTPEKKVPPRIRAKSNQHPGMSGFGHWYEVETSLYRIYTLTRKDGEQVVPPYIPHSYRGNVSIFLHVTNSTNKMINVYWVDYKGAHVPKGTVKPNLVWTQSTWIDHPWVFEDAETSEVYLYYIPYRVIPTLPTASTISPEDNDTGMHKFSFIPSKADDPYLIGVSDSIMPHPAISHFREPLHGITWTLTHMSRTIVPEDPSIQTLQKFLTNIINHPETVKYRQLRIASQQVKPIWDSPMRGLLLSVGFVEVEGYAELGCHAEPLSPSRVQEVALLSHLLREWVSRDSAFSVNQPLGALDGFGRHGFGRAGTMS